MSPLKAFFNPGTAKQALYWTEVFGHRLYLGPLGNMYFLVVATQIFFEFSPRNFGEEKIQFAEHIFQKGLVQPPTSFLLCVIFVDEIFKYHEIHRLEKTKLKGGTFLFSKKNAKI